MDTEELESRIRTILIEFHLRWSNPMIHYDRQSLGERVTAAFRDCKDTTVNKQLWKECGTAATKARKFEHLSNRLSKAGYTVNSGVTMTPDDFGRTVGKAEIGRPYPYRIHKSKPRRNS